ncbi:hypothetical protein BB8028_0006g05670 [Beauveria bassiana]|uniref:Uncharacterized protein n=1 Tax=Beauveria bassiana TaxID=176275 RepID=A0A2S7YJ90_BEABA|nr:hypothetical protein BB8028_0006g05670 [Beauveria bassiana]
MVSHVLLTILAAAAGTALATPIDVRDAAVVEESCTTTVFHAAQYTFGPTQTVWTETATATQEVDCHGCDAIETSYLNFGPGPVVFFTTTVTAATPSTTTEMVCRSTPTGDA